MNLLRFAVTTGLLISATLCDAQVNVNLFEDGNFTRATYSGSLSLLNYEGYEPYTKLSEESGLAIIYAFGYANSNSSSADIGHYTWSNANSSGEIMGDFFVTPLGTYVNGTEFGFMWGDGGNHIYIDTTYENGAYFEGESIWENKLHEFGLVSGEYVFVYGEDTITVTIGPFSAYSLDEFTQSFGATAAIPRVTYALPSSIINGSHHRLLLEQKELNKDNAFWALGDFADHHRDDAQIGTSEVGMAHDFAPGLRGGLGTGVGYLDQDLSYGGSHELDGQYLMGELDYQIPDTTVILSVTGVYGDWESDISRGYLNGGLPDLSNGTTDIESSSVRFRADWLDLFNVGGVSFSPRVAYTITQIDRDAYTETGGGFPATFNGDSYTAKEIRVGLTGEKQLSEKIALRGIIEGVHRDDRDSGNFSGEVIGLFDFSIPGQDIEQEWVRAGLELGCQIDEGKTFTTTAFGATEGEDPQLTIALGLHIDL